MNQIIGNSSIKNREDKITMLEQLIDNDGLDGVLHLLALVASEKSDHIQTNYAVAYDEYDPEAIRWDNIAAELIKLELKLETI